MIASRASTTRRTVTLALLSLLVCVNARAQNAPAEVHAIAVSADSETSARDLLRHGHYGECAAMATRLVAQNRANSQMLTLLGEANVARGMLADATAAFRDASAAGDRRARLQLARLLRNQGAATDAQPLFQSFIDDYNDGRITETDAEGLSYVAMAARALESPQDANDAFQESVRAGDRVETEVEWAALFLDAHDPGHAAESVHAALQLDADDPLAHAMAARVKLEQNFDFVGARAECDKAEQVNPQIVACLVMRAGMSLRDENVEEADAFLDRALAVCPNDLEALSVRAAVRYIDDDERGFERASAAVLSANPHYSTLFEILSGFAEWEHRYPDLVRMGHEALRVDPNDASAYEMLGENLLRAGDERSGVLALRESWRRDEFNVRVYNQLNFYDHVVGAEYTEHVHGPFVFRMHRDERRVLEPYVDETMTRAYDSMVRRYGVRPEGPLHIEMYANPEHFAVRTSGLPNLGVQGVCFGKVVTGISPAGGPFNWGNIFWHELAHVFHLQLSKNHVPRWFTEGLAEYETMIARPEWNREDDRRLFRALNRGKLPRLRFMTEAFTHAHSPEEMLLAYYASSQVAKYLVERFGFDVVPRMLRAWGEGKRTPEVIQAVLGMSVDALDSDFRAATKARLSRFSAADFSGDADPYVQHLTAAARALHSRDVVTARRETDAAIAIDPEPNEAFEALFEIAKRTNDAPLREHALVELTRADQHNRAAHAELLAIYVAREDWAHVISLGENAIFVNPAMPLLHEYLARAYFAMHRQRDARREAHLAIELDAGAKDRLPAGLRR